MGVPLRAGRTRGGHAASYLPRDLCGGRPEAEAGGRVLLLLHAFNPGAEVKLHVEALLRGEVLRGGVTMTTDIQTY